MIDTLEHHLHGFLFTVLKEHFCKLTFLSIKISYEAQIQIPSATHL